MTTATEDFNSQIERLSEYVTDNHFTHSAGENLLLNETLFSFNSLKEYVDSINLPEPKSNLESGLDSLVSKLEDSIGVLKDRLMDLKNKDTEVKEGIDSLKLIDPEITQNITTIINEQGENKELMNTTVSELKDEVSKLYDDDSEHTSILNATIMDASSKIESRVTSLKELNVEKINSDLNILKEMNSQIRKETNTNRELEETKASSIELKSTETDITKDISDLKGRYTEMSDTLNDIQVDQKKTYESFAADHRTGNRKIRRIGKTLLFLHNDSIRGALKGTKRMIPIAGSNGKIDSSWLRS